MDFPAGAPDIPDAAPSETLFSMHQGLTHHVGTNRILLNLVQLATKLGFGTSAPGSGPGVLRRTASGASAWDLIRQGDYGPASVRAVDMVGPGAGSANTVVQTVNGTDVVFGGIVPAAIGAGGTAGMVLATANGTTSAMQKVVTDMLGPNAVSQSDFKVGVASQPQVAVGSGEQNLPDMAITMTTLAGSTVWCHFVGTFFLDVLNNYNIGFSVDAAPSVGVVSTTQTTTGMYMTVSASWRFGGLTAASHTFRVRWLCSLGTLTGLGLSRYFFAQEMRR